MNFDYFYGEQSESYAFYRTPKVFFTDERFRGLSSDAKILYGILLDRVSMSARNKWLDEEGRVYVYMTLSSIEYSIGCCKQKAVNLLTELEEFGLIERKRQGQGKPTRVYVKNFILVWNSYLKEHGDELPFDNPGAGITTGYVEINPPVDLSKSDNTQSIALMVETEPDKAQAVTPKDEADKTSAKEDNTQESNQDEKKSEKKKSVKKQIADKKEKSEKTVKSKKVDTKNLGEAI